MIFCSWIDWVRASRDKVRAFFCRWSAKVRDEWQRGKKCAKLAFKGLWIGSIYDYRKKKKRPSLCCQMAAGWKTSRNWRGVTFFCDFFLWGFLVLSFLRRVFINNYLRVWERLWIIKNWISTPGETPLLQRILRLRFNMTLSISYFCFCFADFEILLLDIFLDRLYFLSMVRKKKTISLHSFFLDQIPLSTFQMQVKIAILDRPHLKHSTVSGCVSPVWPVETTPNEF